MGKKIFLIISIGILMLLCGCERMPIKASEEDNLVIINNTPYEFWTIYVEATNFSQGRGYEDSIIKGDAVGFKLFKYAQCDIDISIMDKDNVEIFKSQKFRANTIEDRITIIINEDENGKLYAEVSE